MKERCDIEKEFKWDLSVVFPSSEAFEREYSLVGELVAAYPRHETTMLNGAAELYAALSDYYEIDKRLDVLYIFAALGFYVDTSDNSAQALESRVRALAIKSGEATWFVTPYLQRLDKETLSRYYQELPELQRFERVLYMTLRTKEHMLSDECEKMYSVMEDCLYLHSGTRQIFANSDLRFGSIRDDEGKKVEITDANYVSLLMSADRRVRRNAFKTLYSTYNQFGNTFATMYSNHVKEYTTISRLRRYESSLHRSTFADELTPEIYENLISTVSSNLAPLYDYYELKRELLGLSKLHLYDIYRPLISESVRKYSYDEARREVLDMARVFTDEYYDTFREGLYDKCWVDVYPSRGKRSGAFSAGCYGTEPYILMNFTGDFEDVSTLAHEGGHSMHSYFSRKYNEQQNSSYTLFVAEVASTVNELLLLRKKLRESESDAEKLAILNSLMELYKATLYRQTMLAEFERNAHKMSEDGVPLTREVLNNSYYKTVKKYFGKDVVCDKEIAMEWMRIPHFYTSFYVYKYATSISAASAIVERIEAEGSKYAEQYIEFLKCGGSKSPLESLLVAGIDMTSPSVVESAIETFRGAVEEFREIYKRIKENEND